MTATDSAPQFIGGPLDGDEVKPPIAQASFTVAAPMIGGRVRARGTYRYDYSGGDYRCAGQIG